jgi:hypothetical protein
MRPYQVYPSDFIIIIHSLFRLSISSSQNMRIDEENLQAE